MYLQLIYFSATRNYFKSKYYVICDYIILFCCCCSTQVWPLSLLALRQLTNDLQINRDYQNDENVLRCGKANKFRSKYDAENLQNKSEKMHAAFSKCNNLFLKHVKIKKRHELQQMARV